MDVKTKQVSPFLVYAVVIAICVVMLVFSAINYYINLSVKFIGNLLLYPMTLVSKVSTELFGSISSSWENLTKGMDKIKALEEENESLREKVALIEYYETENKRLQILLNVVQSISYKVEVANIISAGFDSAEETVIIDKGTAHGITKNMPVIAYFMGNIALIGVVREAYLTTSIVETVVSPNLNVGVMLESSQETGILCGNGKFNNTATVKYISETVDVKVGTEKVYTFSRSLNFPPGLLVGTVVLSKKRERSKFQELIVKPAIDIKNISSVMVIKHR
ncbi:MAG: rod shape-determining protein MreC [Brevinematia bacterium]